MRSAKSEKGFSLIEVTIGVAVLALIALGFLLALNTAIIVTTQAKARTTAESLTESQMEKIKSGGYVVAQGGTANYTATISANVTGFRFYTLDSSNNTVANRIYGIAWDIASNSPWTKTTPSDPGIQKITIIMQSNAGLNSKGVYKEVFRLSDFEVNR